MKKIVAILFAICIYKSSTAQSQWDMNLNNITPPFSPNFGTQSNDPINFYTGGAQKMSLGVNGVLQVNGLSGSGSRFLQVDGSGNLVPWTGGGPGIQNSILFGDGTWRANLIKVDGNNMFTPTGSKFGIGITNPFVALDVSGDVAATGAITATGGFKFNSQYKLIFDGTNNIFSLAKGSSYQPPTIDICSTLPTISWSNSDGFVSSQAFPSSAPSVNAALRMYIAPNNGSGYIELNGVDNNNRSANALFINYNCGRNTNINTGPNSGIVSIGSSYSNSQVFMGDYVNMNKHVEIGNPTSGITGSPTNIALDIYANSGSGIRLKTDIDNIPVLKVEDKSNSILKNSFTVLGDGSTQIKTDNTNALMVGYSQGIAPNFKLFADGNIEVTSQVADAIKVKNPINGNMAFNVGSNGYTEIQVYPALMPTPTGGTNPRVMTVKDMTNNRDLFVLLTDGKLYAREIEINNVPVFPDYVFNKDYSLMPIKQLAKYINENKHLPGFEKGSSYEKKGININQMFIMQQEKIEELTLYIIELERLIREIKENN